MDVYEKIKAEGLRIREYCNPDWPFTTAVQTGNILFVSGHTPTLDRAYRYILDCLFMDRLDDVQRFLKDNKLEPLSMASLAY